MTHAPDALRFAGYAALFDVPDGIADTIVAGAFARTLRQRDGPIPLYWQHSPDQQIGVVDKISEDDRGLAIVGRIDNPDGRAAKALANRKVDGLSFGYRATGYARTVSGRQLTDIDLFEVSLVTHPLQPHARVHLIA